MKANLKILLFLFVLLETIAHVHGVKRWDINTATLVYFFSGILIAVLPMLPAKSTTRSTTTDRQLPLQHLFLLIFGVFLFFFSTYLYQWATKTFALHAYDASSDMLIIIKKMGERFLSSNKVYEIMPIWGGTEPIYLPAMWLPFLPTIYFDLDVRWTSICCLLIGAYWLFFIGQKGKYTPIFMLVLIPLIYLLNGLLHTDYRLISLSEEPVVVAYYLFLAYTLSRKNPYLIGLAIALCLMSRFALVFWVAMYLVFVFVGQSRKMAIQIGGTILVVTTFLLLGTEAAWQLDVILGLPKIYLEHIMANEWMFDGFATTNLGMVKYFGFENVPMVHRAFFFISICIPLFSLGCFWKFKVYLDQTFFAICSLKLSLVFFYNFLLMPFLYLFYTSTFLSIAILSWYLKEDD